MKNSRLYSKYLQALKKDLSLLPDKPEETYESTLSALWLFAAGNPVPAEVAVTLPLPSLENEQIKKLEELVSRRLEGEPLAHITGRQQFMGVELLSSAKALIPRKETEILGNAALEILKTLAEKQKKIKVFDLCCGAGNLAVSLAVHVPEAEFWASDLSEDALELASENVHLHGLEKRIRLLAGSVFEAFESDEYYERMDMVICNPPYISETGVSKMNREISGHEPELAFNGGMLGLDIIRELIRNAPRFLKEDGWLAFEVGQGQGDFVKQLCVKTSLYREVDTVKDKDGNARVILAQKKPE